MALVTATIGRHGVVSVSTADLDRAMTKYLPASPARLRSIVEERSLIAHEDVLDVSALLLILADFDRTDG